MSLRLAQIPGFADVADSNFAAGQFAIGLNFQRTVDNAKLGLVRPEVFIGKYINGDTVTLPTSVVDGYTYSRDELSYFWHFALTGGTSTANNGAPTSSGAIRYMVSDVNQLTGVVSTTVEYLVANGSAPVVTNDGTLEVFTLATRRQTSLVAQSSPVYSPVLDSEMVTDAAVSESLMQRINRNAKFAALRAEVIYLGEYVNGDVAPMPISPADGYEYSSPEVIFHTAWRWTTQGDQLVDPPDANHKQIQNIAASVASDGTVTVSVTYYNSGYYPTDNGRVAVFAFCQRTVSLGAGTVDFVDLSVDFLASGRFVRADVLGRQVRNTRYATARREYFAGDYSDGSSVTLPVSPLDGYQYSRDELSYVYAYKTTAVGNGSDIRIQSWASNVDQTTGAVSSKLTRVHDGGGLVSSTDGVLRVVTMAHRNDQPNDALDYIYTQAGSGGVDFKTMQDGSFDSWTSPTSQTASAWSIRQQNNGGYGAQAPGLVSGFSQRLGTSGASGSLFSVMSSSVSISQGVLFYASWVMKPSAANLTGLSVVIHLFNEIGDSVTFEIFSTSQGLQGGQTQQSTWFQIPFRGDSTVATNSRSAYAAGGTVGMVTPLGASVPSLDFSPSTMRMEFVYSGPGSTFLDLDDAALTSQTDPSAGQVAQRGSSSLAFFPAIQFTVTDTVFQPVLEFTVQRADNSITMVSDGSPQVTGLPPATPLLWYPFLDERTRHVGNITTGGVGTPPWLHTDSTRENYAAWYSVNNLPFAASPIQVTTLASSTTGDPVPPAGGSGGGDDGCLMSTMLVREFTRGYVPASHVRLGDFLHSENDTWLEVVHTESAGHQDWCELELSHGGHLTVTTGHPFQTVDGDIVRAHDLTLQHLLSWTHGVCSPVSIRYVKRLGTKVKITLRAPHVFFAGAEADRMTLTHNYSMPSQGTS